MRLYGNGTLLNGIALSVQLEKSRSEAAATLTAVLLTGVGDTYLQKTALGTGNVVRLEDDEGKEAFLGAIQTLQRGPERIVLTACDQGLYLTQNELSGVFAGSPGTVCRTVARRLGLPVGTLAVPEGYVCIVARSGRSAFSILRQAVGSSREVGIRNGRLTVTDPGGSRCGLRPERVLEVSSRADLRQMVNRCIVVDRRGAAVARAENGEAVNGYGLRQRVLGKSGDAAAQARAALTGRRMGGQARVWGDLSYRCGADLELDHPLWGLTGTYPITSVCHRWEAGLFTTDLTWEEADG